MRRFLLVFSACWATGCGIFASDSDTAPTVPQPSYRQDGFPQESPSEGVSAPTEENATPVDIRRLERDSTSDVEIRWLRPEEPVDGYIIRYGFSRDRMILDTRVTVAQLNRAADIRGDVLIYRLENIPEHSPVFISLAAYRGEEISPPSEVIEVPASESK